MIFTETERKRKIIINVVYYAMILGLFYFFLKYAFGLFFPILFSFLVAIILQRPANAIAKKTPLKKGAASAVCVFLLLLIIVSIFALIGTGLINYLKDFMQYLKTLFENTDQLINDIETWLLNISAKLPESISKLVTKNISDIFVTIRTSISDEEIKMAADAAGQSASSGGFSFDLSILSTPLSGVFGAAKQIPTMFVTAIITLVASCFLTADYDKVTAFVYAQLSENKQQAIQRAKYLLKNSFVKILRAYALIILVTFVEMSIGLTVLSLLGIFKSKYIIIIAAVTAIVDILPVLGTGTVVFPWAAYSLITGDIAMAIGLIVIYAVISVIRQVIEPKLVAGQLGLSPFVTIIGMFIGLKLFGFIGMLIMPILIIMLKLLNDEGILHLWNSVPSDENEEAEASKKPRFSLKMKKKKASVESEETDKTEE